MKELREYIFEMFIEPLDSLAGFSIEPSSKEECIDWCKGNYKKYGITSEVVEMLYGLESNKIPLIFKDKNGIGVKIKRYIFTNKDYIKKLNRYLKKEYKDGDTNIKFKNSSASVLIGNGSSGSRAGINTEKQEEMICDVFNRCVEGKIFNNDDYIAICKEYGLDDSYVSSVEGQCKSIIKYLDEEKFNKQNLRAIRFSTNSKSDICKSICNLYKNKDIFGSGDINISNPSDIYIYDYKKEKDIINTYNTISNSTDFTIIFKELLNLFTSGICIGVSLKKIIKSPYDPVKMNLDKTNMPTTDNINISKILLNTNIKAVSAEKDPEGPARGIYIHFNYKLNDILTNVDMYYRSNKSDVSRFTYEFKTLGKGGQDGKAGYFLNDCYNKMNRQILDVTYLKDIRNLDDNQLTNLYINTYKKIDKTLVEISSPITQQDFINIIRDTDNNIKDITCWIQKMDFCAFLSDIKKGLLVMDGDVFTVESFLFTSHLRAKKISPTSTPYLLIS